MKKLNKKGFTLVELLAVIVILALLMVVLVPKAIEAINNSRANTFVEGYQAFINTVELKYSEGSLDDATCNSGEEGADSKDCGTKYGLAKDYTATIMSDGTVYFYGYDGRFNQANIDKFGTYFKTKETVISTDSESTTKKVPEPDGCDATKIQKGATSCGYCKGTETTDPCNAKKGPYIVGKIDF